MIHYKVLSNPDVDGGGSWCYNSTGAARYRNGLTTNRKQNCGPLATFKTFEDAAFFLLTQSNSRAHFAIHECTIDPSTDKDLWCPNQAGVVAGKLPQGTILADSVTLGRRVLDYRGTCEVWWDVQKLLENAVIAHKTLAV